MKGLWVYTGYILRQAKTRENWRPECLNSKATIIPAGVCAPDCLIQTPQELQP